jgi:RNA 2',3'-cyclic 3'-phosphodiesterase
MRLFIALPLPDEVQDCIVLRSAHLRSRYSGLKWTGRDALHITLVFLGETEERLVDVIAEKMRRSADLLMSYTIKLHGLGTFPPKGRPRVLYLRVEKGGEESQRVFSVLRRELGDLAGRKRRRFSPHLTLARVREGEKVPDLEEGNDLRFTFPVSRMVLYRSHLSPKGARYEPLAEAELRGEN